MDKVTAQLKKPWYVAALFSFSCGLFIHLFGLVNVLHNHDSIYRVPTGYGSGIPSGRWFLTVLGDLNKSLFGGYNLAWFNGVLFIALIALSVGLFVGIFQIRSRRAAALMGMCMVAFPSVASILFYRFTSVYYGLAIFLAIFAAYAIVKYKFGFPVAVLCIAFSMGIYQAFVSFTVAIFIVLLIVLSLDSGATLRKIALTGTYYAAVLILGAVAYFLLMKLSLVIYDTNLVDYKGISDMGQLSISKLPAMIKSAFLPVVKLPLKDYRDIAQTKLTRLSYLVIGVICAVEIGILFFKKTKNYINIICCLIFCLLLPIAVNFVSFMCSVEDIYTLMVFSFVMILFLPVILQELLPSFEGKMAVFTRYLKKATAVILIIISFCYCYQTNTNYTIQFYNNQQLTNYYNRIITQTQMTEGYDTGKKWVFIGNVEDPLLTKSWNNINLIGGNMTFKSLISFRQENWIRAYLGISIPTATAADKAALIETDAVQNMPCWPNEGSIQIIDNFVVIKLGEVTKK